MAYNEVDLYTDFSNSSETFMIVLKTECGYLSVTLF